MISKIAIFEDDPVSLTMMSRVVRSLGYETVLYEDGVEIFDALSSDDEVDMIITDFMMPKLNGKELIRALKDIQGCKNIPVIMVSAVIDEIDTHDLEHENFAFLLKPFNKHKLAEVIERFNKQASI